MSLTLDEAYQQIKNFEQAGQIPLPEPQQTVVVGDIDAQSGAFKWEVPTMEQTLANPTTSSSSKTENNSFSITGGQVYTTAVDLLLKFDIKNARNIPPFESAGFVGATKTHAAKRTGFQNIGGTWSSGVTIQETQGLFPTLVSNQTEIILDAGPACSKPVQAATIDPAITSFELKINAAGQDQSIFLFILRAPVLGVGAFTIPALPVTLMYAPPQGKLLQNYTQYTEEVSITRTIASSFASSTATKAVQAYSVGDLLGKAAGLIADAVAVVTAVNGAASGSGAGAGSGTSGSGGSGPGDSGGGFKSAQAVVKFVSDLAAGLSDSTTETDTTTLTVEDDNSVSVTYSSSESFGTPAGAGPGIGDRFLYLKNVRALWMALNGEVGIHILGWEETRKDTAQTLIADQQALTTGGPAVTGLDATTLGKLLALDPFCVYKYEPFSSAGPLIAPPRFVLAEPTTGGTGTSPMGDIVSKTYEMTAEDKGTQTQIKTTATDFKPGWLNVILGEDNTETATTFTMSISQLSDAKTDEEITEAVYYFSDGPDDTYEVSVYYDRLFEPLLFIDPNSLLLSAGTDTHTGGVLTAGTI